MKQNNQDVLLQKVKQNVLVVLLHIDALNFFT